MHFLHSIFKFLGAYLTIIILNSLSGRLHCLFGLVSFYLSLSFVLYFYFHHFFFLTCSSWGLLFPGFWVILLQAGFRKGRGTRDQIANIWRIIKKAREFQKNIYFCFIDYAKAFDCMDHNKLWEILKEMGIPDHLTCLLRNLYVG